MNNKPKVNCPGCGHPCPPSEFNSLKLCRPCRQARGANLNARLYDADDTLAGAEWQLVLDHYAPNGQCLACGEQKELTLDHIVAVSRGGTNTIDNLQPLCRSCNAQKSYRRFTDYRPDKGAKIEAIMRAQLTEILDTSTDLNEIESALNKIAHLYTAHCQVKEDSCQVHIR